MEKNKNDWGVLLNKYIRDELTPEGKEELDRQMQASPIKQRQFKDRTDPVEFMKNLKAVYYADSESSWKKIEKMLQSKKK